MVEAVQSIRSDQRIVTFRVGDRLYAVSADQVARVVGAHIVTQTPFLPRNFSGIAALGGKVVPVLGLPDTIHSSAQPELILVTVNSTDYALEVDRAVRIDYVGEQFAQEARLIRIEDLLASSSPKSTGSSLASAQRKESASAAVRKLDFESRLLAVETEASCECLSMGWVVELCETLPIIAIPDPIFAGAVLYRDALVPLISLGALLGRPEKAGGGPFVLVYVEGRRCALAVKSVIGLSTEERPAVDLPSLLAKLRPESGSAGVNRGRADSGERYMLAELAGHLCAIALDSVAHIHAAARAWKIPGTILSAIAIGGRILPAVDLGQLLDLPISHGARHFIELGAEDFDTFVIAVDRVTGIVSIARDAVIQQSAGGAIGAVARIDGRLVWILSPLSMANQARVKRNAA